MLEFEVFLGKGNRLQQLRIEIAVCQAKIAF